LGCHKEYRNGFGEKNAVAAWAYAMTRRLTHAASLRQCTAMALLLAMLAIVVPVGVAQATQP
jgi:hypothetical protein